VGQGFPPQQAKRAAFQIVREIHSAHDEYDARTVEEIIQEAILRARRERNAKGDA
jgi:hypothetical protein